jgi:alpha-galactosidase
MRTGKLLYVMTLALISTKSLSALENGLARTPPMGWNSWNHFRYDTDPQLFKDMADAMVSSGMQECGYKYINIDAGWWSGGRDADGNIAPNA